MEEGDFKTRDLDSQASKPVLLFGKDIREIKCFRDSFIFGISFGVVGGLATFLVTSKTLFSTHMTFASFWLGTFGYWFPCRYKYETSQLKIKTLTKGFENKNIELISNSP